MDHSRRSPGTGFAADFDEFDLLLDDEGGPSGATATAAPPRPTRTGRTRAAATPAPEPAGTTVRRRPSIRITPDWNRLAAVLFVAAVVAAIAWFAVSSILDARRAGAYEDYFGEVREVATQSTGQGKELDTILVDPNGGDRAQRIARIEQVSSRASKLAGDAARIEAPEQLREAHGWLLTSLEYRAAGLDALERALSASIDSKDQEAAAAAVAAAMARLVASDVLWADSFAVEGRTVLREDGVDGVTVSDSVFVESLDSLGPKAIGAMLDRLTVSAKASPEGTAKVPDDGRVRGGQLEAGRVTVAPSGQTLVPNGLTEIKGGEGISFEIPFTNQGEVQLTEVPIKVTLRGTESEPMTLTGVIAVVDPGQTATGKVSLNEAPNFGEVLEMDVLVGPIPGEKTADNNRGAFQLRFAL